MEAGITDSGYTSSRWTYLVAKLIKRRNVTQRMTLQCNHQCTMRFGSLEVCQYCEALLAERARRSPTPRGL